MAERFDKHQIGELADKRVLVTGGNSGIGLEAVRMFAAAGADVLLAARDPQRGQEAASAVQRAVRGTISVRQLDLAALSSVRRLAAQLIEEGRKIDVLVNNAGVMAIPRLEHRAWFGDGRMRRYDLQGEQRYKKWEIYAYSKLANLLFTFELERRLRAAGTRVHAYACHPGYAATKLQQRGPEMEGSTLMGAFMQFGNALMAQSAEMGALPTLYAAVGDLPGGSFVGPTAFGGMRGRPTLNRARESAYDEAQAAQLWSVSEQLTGVRYALGNR